MDSEDETTDPNSEIGLMSKEWVRMQESRFKEGFVNGSLAGQEETLQSAFNAGFKQGFLSNYILSKIRGILRALLAYQAAYEGNPITDGILLEAHGLLEEISSLEANAVAEEFLKMSLHQNGQNQSFADAISQKLSSASIMNTSQETQHHGVVAADRMSADDFNSSHLGAMDTDGQFPINTLSLKDVNAILLQCPPILNTVNKCKSILRSLNWTDEMIDSLL